MKNLLRNSRFYILTGNLLFSILIYLFIALTTPLGILQLGQLQQVYSFLSIIYLYLALLIGPLCYTFSIPWKRHITYARRAIGVSAFYFALLHALISFFGQLGGFSGIAFFDGTYLLALGTGLAGLIILFLLTITSLDYAVNIMHFNNWKLLQRLVYLGGVLVLIHIVLLGTHYANLSSVPSQITFFALTFLLLLEAPRVDKLIKKLIPIPRFGLSFVVLFGALATTYFTIIHPLIPSQSGTLSFDIHAAHRQLAQQAAQQQGSGFNPNLKLSSIPGLDGDRTKRYTVSMNTDPINPQPNQDVTINFTIYDANSGNRISFFRSLYSKPMHFIIVNNELTYFTHIHPTEDDQGNFSITAQFPSPDMYHLYIEFYPFGGIEQQVGFALAVGSVDSQNLPIATQPIDKSLTKTFGNYEVTLDPHGTLRADQMSYGFQTISFTLRDATTKKPITTIKPYLDAFGHLTLINEKDYSFLHVHPYSLIVPPPNANGGPTVDFLPIGIYGPFKPGIYRAFAEFNPDGNLFTADFTVKIQ